MINVVAKKRMRTVNLPPAHVIPEILHARVHDGAAVETRHGRRERLLWEVRRPEVDVVRGESGGDGGDELAVGVARTGRRQSVFFFPRPLEMASRMVMFLTPLVSRRGCSPYGR